MPALGQAATPPATPAADDATAWTGVMACAAQQGVQLPAFGVTPSITYNAAQGAVIEACIKAGGLGASRQIVGADQTIPAGDQKRFAAARQCAAQSGVDLPATGGPPARPYTPAEGQVIDACLKTAGLGPNAPPHQSAAEKATAQKIEAQYRAAQSCALQQNVRMPDAGDAAALVNPTPAETAVIMACLQKNGLGPQAQSTP